jgi:hypothetical protein
MRFDTKFSLRSLLVSKFLPPGRKEGERVKLSFLARVRIARCYFAHRPINQTLNFAIGFGGKQVREKRKGNLIAIRCDY